jgi:hypothetical protein
MQRMYQHGPYGRLMPRRPRESSAKINPHPPLHVCVRTGKLMCLTWRYCGSGQRVLPDRADGLSTLGTDVQHRSERNTRHATVQLGENDKQVFVRIRLALPIGRHNCCISHDIPTGSLRACSGNDTQVTTSALSQRAVLPRSRLANNPSSSRRARRAVLPATDMTAAVLTAAAWWRIAGICLSP